MTGENKNLEKAVFGAGCFWCTEAVFEQLEGVERVESGYAGSTALTTDGSKTLTYKEVSTGLTGYVEAVQVTYDPEKISYEELLEVFWNTHNPTEVNRQGPDMGPQYSSVIYYVNNGQKMLAEKSKAELEKSKKYNDKIATAIVSLKNFFKAEGYHQDYYRQNNGAPYCQSVITPKLDKFKKEFESKLKK